MEIEETPDLSSLPNSSITILKPDQFFIPGFIDCHIHAVQLPNIGTGYDKNLLDWLNTYTFPLERKFSDEKYADKVFDAVVVCLIKIYSFFFYIDRIMLNIKIVIVYYVEIETYIVSWYNYCMLFCFFVWKYIDYFGAKSLAVSTTSIYW